MVTLDGPACCNKDCSKYMLLAGLNIGPKDPNQMVFLQPFVKEANKLSSEGFSWIYKGKKVVSKVISLCAVTDSAARCQLLDMQSFHAYYGCTFYSRNRRKQAKDRGALISYLRKQMKERQNPLIKMQRKLIIMER